MAWSTPDLSTITKTLHDLLQSAIQASPITPFNVNVSGSSPESVRKAGGECQLSIYLLHVGRDPFWRNTPVQGPRPQLNTAQPLSLNLYYLLTAYADADFVSEQQAMSIALHCFHERPIFKTPTEEFSISIEADTIEEMSRLWQALATPIRLSSVIKVGVVFVASSQQPGPPAPPPTKAHLAVGPFAADVAPQLYGTATTLGFGPTPLPPTPDQVTVAAGPLAAVGGETLLVGGAGLDQPNAADVFLSVPNTGTEWLVTNPWRQSPASASELRLALPAAYTNPTTHLPAPPAATPPPGVYLLSVGSQIPPLRSGAIPLTIAARIDNLASPPILVPDGTGLYTIQGAGFVPGATVLALDAVALEATGVSPPGQGLFFADPSGTSIAFKLPSPAPASGQYAVQIRVNGIACAPNWLVNVP